MASELEALGVRTFKLKFGKDDYERTRTLNSFMVEHKMYCLMHDCCTHATDDMGG